MIKFHADCMACLAQGALKKADAVRDGEVKARYMGRVCAILAEADVQRDSAPLVDARLIALRRDMLGIEEDFSGVKHRFNALILGNQLLHRLLALGLHVAVRPDPVPGIPQQLYEGRGHGSPGQLAGVDDEGERFVFNVLLHEGHHLLCWGWGRTSGRHLQAAKEVQALENCLCNDNHLTVVMRSGSGDQDQPICFHSHTG